MKLRLPPGAQETLRPQVLLDQLGPGVGEMLPGRGLAHTQHRGDLAEGRAALVEFEYFPLAGRQLVSETRS